MRQYLLDVYRFVCNKISISRSIGEIVSLANSVFLAVSSSTPDEMSTVAILLLIHRQLNRSDHCSNRMQVILHGKMEIQSPQVKNHELRDRSPDCFKSNTKWDNKNKLQRSRYWIYFSCVQDPERAALEEDRMLYRRPAI